MNPFGNPFTAEPLGFTSKDIMDNYRIGVTPMHQYEVMLNLAAGYEVRRGDGQLMGTWGTRDAAQEAIPGFHRQDYLTIVQQMAHASAHGLEYIQTPMILRERSECQNSDAEEPKCAP